MTAPLTPTDCDLQDFPFMPLHVARLRDSDLAAEEHPEACWYAVMLWSAAWHQLPAGSLPDNETILARLCGLGRDLKTFRKHRAGAMRGFVLCDDGRLYHPIVAEQALAAWESKKQQRWRSECARIKKSNQRNGSDIPAPTYEQFLAGTSPGQTEPGPAFVPEDSALCPEGQQVQETGTGTGRLKKDADASSVAGGDPRQAFDEWNLLAVRIGLPVAKDLTEARRKALKARLSAGGMAAWREALLALEASPMCRGDNDRNWRADIDFVCQAKSFQRLREGFYGTGAMASAGSMPAPVVFDGPAGLRAQVVAEQGEDFAKAWIDPCRWDQGSRTLIARNAFAEARIRRDLGGWLTRCRVNVEASAANDHHHHGAAA
ncbi:MAG: hypothetical protein ACJAVC_002114 [Brevundimonas sp.]|jgi:hypothetical protein